MDQDNRSVLLEEVRNYAEHDIAPDLRTPDFLESPDGKKKQAEYLRKEIKECYKEANREPEHFNAYGPRVQLCEELLRTEFAGY